MTSNKITESELFPKCVLARASCGEPARLTAVGRGETGAIEVYGTDADKTIGFPAEDIFAFDQSLFSRLGKAFTDGDADRLVSLWGKATPLS